ncbi:MAG: cell envelope integrity protein TolA, partial [Oleibacter sp.]|nr:cell envelope integrity protein TolA [Thalassolituus sp.]
AQEKAAKEKAAKAKAEKEAAQKALEQEMMQQLAEEESLIRKQQEAAQRAADERRMAQTSEEYVGLIQGAVQQNWSYPPNVNSTMEVTVRINMLPTGEVVSINILRSSGKAALDRSVEQAIMKAQPLPVPNDIQTFERNFRTFTMTFRPENAAW